jgi:hypothetical protein
MNHVGAGLRDAAHDPDERQDFARSDMAAHWKAAKTERKRWLDIFQRFVGARAAGKAVGNHADPVSARDLLVREVEYMAEQAANRRSKHMQNIERSH